MEALPEYRVEPEYSAYLQWLNDGLAPLEPTFSDWTELLRDSQMRGASVTRVRAFSIPRHPFVDFELHLLRMNVMRGEQIYLLERQVAGPDFWLFDDQVVAIQRYDHDGRYLGADVSSDPELVDRCLEVRRITLADATPLPA